MMRARRTFPCRLIHLNGGDLFVDPAWDVMALFRDRRGEKHSTIHPSTVDMSSPGLTSDQTTEMDYNYCYAFALTMRLMTTLLVELRQRTGLLFLT